MVPVSIRAQIAAKRANVKIKTEEEDDLLFQNRVGM